MSFLKALEIYPSDVQIKNREQALSLLPALIGTDESSAGYSWRGALQQRPLPLHRPESACYGFKRRPRTLQQMATCPEFRCLTSGVHSITLSTFYSGQAGNRGLTLTIEF
jgi:hypothetical protein